MNIEKFLKQRNIVRNKKQANIIMIAFIVLCIFTIIMVSKKDTPQYDTNNNEGLSAEEIELMELDIAEENLLRS